MTSTAQMYRLNPNLKSFWTTRKPYKLLRGGRFSSKTQDAGGMAAFLARNYSLRFLCLRQFQNRISDSVYTIIKDKIEQAGWSDEFDIGVSSIKHKTTGSEFLFYGIARNINEIKGTEGIDICWIEEAEGLTEAQWAVIDPTIRKEGSEVWILWNPRLTTDFVQVKLPQLLGEDCIIRHINYDENPFLSDTAKQKAERLKLADYDEYEHIYLGVPRSDDERVVIKLSWIEAAIDAHIKLNIEPTGLARLGFDIADDGGDMNATVSAKGMLAYNCDEWKGAEDELLKSCSRAYKAAEAIKAMITYDCIGVGASAGGKFAEINESRSPFESEHMKYEKFNAGSGVIDPESYYGDSEILNKDFFSNLKAQAWWNVADRFRNTYNAVTKGESFPQYQLISIASDMPHLDKLKRELSTPRRDYDNNGKVKVESKKDLAKRDVPSPNLADAFIMAFAPREVPQEIGVVRRTRR